MFRQVAVRFTQTAKSALTLGHLSRPLVASQQVRHSSQQTNEEFDNDWVDYFNREDLDDWALRRGLNELYGFDLVPEPKIVSAALRACRRLNDHAMAVRILESVKAKSVQDASIYPFIIQEIRPTLDELGISTPEELGLDQPDAEKQRVD
ncbi:cytochrome c oxidase subunit 5A, mitochondrial-like isoform X2 [Amphiura filiformis]|uniref:cytochrome c oxidase subunit 5A, mitochondrial-like isoform X2 n=1 Tax=Amphiura filiformis TaxID=82378 RepID=UPI003B2249EE